MPNDCQNTLVLKHSNQLQLERALKSLEVIKDSSSVTSFFEEFQPTPDGHDRSEIHGTKWDAYDPFDVKILQEGVLIARFYTAWSPPISFFEFMSKNLGFDVTATFFEPGHEIVGGFTSFDGCSFGVDSYNVLKAVMCLLEGKPMTLLEVDKDFGRFYNEEYWYCHRCYNMTFGDYACADCDNKFCDKCLVTCVTCLDRFCSTCSMINYDKRDERSFCLECYKLNETAAEPCVPCHRCGNDECMYDTDIHGNGIECRETCSFCCRPFCENCLVECLECSEVFCSTCSMTNYDEREERMFCLCCTELNRERGRSC